MKQTAVEWLFLMLNNPNRNQEFANKLLEKAKEIEKEQIRDAYGQGTADEAGEILDATKDAEQYYNETYGR